MTKTSDQKTHIEANRQTITEMLSGVGTHKRLNNVNWLRHELSYTEPKTLFYMPQKEQSAYLDYNSIRNIGDAYDYIINHTDTPIDITEICRIHSILCTGTNISGGTFRTTEKTLEIQTENGRYHAPSPYEIRTRMRDIIYKMQNSKESSLIKAYNIHYDLITLQPFDDFNKRTARMIMNWVLIQNGYRPIVFNHPSDKQKYRESIGACINGNTKKYTSYMYSCTRRTQEQIIKLLTKSKVM